MRPLTDGERDILRECERDAAEAEHAWGLASPTEDDLDAMAAEYDTNEPDRAEDDAHADATGRRLVCEAGGG